MNKSRWIIAVVILAVAGVVIAKGTLKSRPARSQQMTESSDQERQSTPTAADRPVDTSSRPGVTPPPEKDKPAAGRDEHDGPLPGSALAGCLTNGLPTMADFGKTWCKPCKAMVPILKQAAREYRGKANIVFVNLEKYGKLGRGYRIKAMPTQIFFDARGKEVSRHIGFLDGDGIDSRLRELGAEK